MPSAVACALVMVQGCTCCQSSQRVVCGMCCRHKLLLVHILVGYMACTHRVMHSAEPARNSSCWLHSKARCSAVQCTWVSCAVHVLYICCIYAWLWPGQLSDDAHLATRAIVLSWGRDQDKCPPRLFADELMEVCRTCLFRFCLNVEFCCSYTARSRQFACSRCVDLCAVASLVGVACVVCVDGKQGVLCMLCSPACMPACG